MKSSPKIKEVVNKQPISWLVYIAITFFAFLIASMAYAYIYNYWYQGKFFPGVFVGSINIGGLNYKEAQIKLNRSFDHFGQKGITYIYEGVNLKISPSIISPTDPDLTYDLIKINTDSSLVKAFAYGRTGFWWQQLFTPLSALLSPKIIVPDIKLDENKLLEIIKNNFSNYETPPHNPIITWQNQNFVLAPEQAGTTFNYENIIFETNERIKNFSTVPIQLFLTNSIPEITLAGVNSLEDNGLQELAKKQPPLTWQVNDYNYVKSFSDYRDNLEFTYNNDDIAIKIQDEWLKQNLYPIKEQVDKVSQDAKFTITDGRVNEFQQSRDGKLLDIQKNIDLINNNFATSTYTVALNIDTDYAKIQTDDVNDLGISKIIGVGISDYSGSPANRIHNIEIGANSLNGLLIKPGEEFSLLDALLPIDATRGYLPELVIKGNETIPEFGGGLCQIGTTAFRAALASGVPITQRQNHSYRVRYYEPAGTDATIYDPAPDFRFLNDTPGHILIQTRSEDTDLIFEFWGTHDGRIATTTYPYIYNITTPPEKKYIETLDLEPGVERCTERAHNGADAEFTYTVTSAEGEVKEKLFKSHYRPWQEVCLIGVEKLSEVEKTNGEE